VTLVSPPEGILLQYLVLLELRSYAPALVVGQCVTILLEECVDTRNTTIPAVFQIFQSEPTVLGIRLLTLQRILGPHALRVDELTLPRLYVPI